MITRKERRRRERVLKREQKIIDRLNDSSKIRDRIKSEIAKIYPERDLPDDFKTPFGGRDYFLP